MKTVSNAGKENLAWMTILILSSSNCILLNFVVKMSLREKVLIFDGRRRSNNDRLWPRKDTLQLWKRDAACFTSTLKTELSYIICNAAVIRYISATCRIRNGNPRYGVIVCLYPWVQFCTIINPEASEMKWELPQIKSLQHKPASWCQEVE